MSRAVDVRARDTWQETPVDTVVLDFDDRHRRRMTMTGTRGFEFLLDLPKAVALRGGDALVLDDGRLVEVIAAPEPLVEVRAADNAQLVRIAYHLGNRHLPTQLTTRGLRIRRDHVIEDMVRGLGARVIEIEAPFDPEGGAYAEGGHAHGHDHAHDHDHGHHGHDHHDHSHHDHSSHDHSHHGHDHGHHHGHDHAHDHDHHHHEHGHSHDHAHHDHSDHDHAHGAHDHETSGLETSDLAHKHKHGV